MTGLRRAVARAAAGTLAAVGFAATAAEAAAAGPPPGPFELVERSSAAAVAEVRGVDATPTRVEVARLAVRQPIVGLEDGQGWRVVHRRRFPSAPALFRKGATVLVLAAPLPDQTEWDAFRGGSDGTSDPAWVEDGLHVLEIPPDEARAWADALSAFARLIARDPRGVEAQAFLTDQLAAEPAALADAAAGALAARLAGPGGASPTLAQLDTALAWLARGVEVRRGTRGDLASAVTARLPASALERLAPLLADPELRGRVVQRLVARARDEAELRAPVRAAAADWSADGDPSVRRAGVAALELEADAPAVERIGAIALDDADDDVAADAVRALDALRGSVPSAYDALGRVSRDARPVTAANAISRLGLADDPRAVTALTTVFESSRSELHVAAVIALLNMNQPAARDAVRRIYLETPDPRLRRAIEAMTRPAH